MPNFKTGVLLVNLGTPDSPAVPDVRKYLRQFLLDGRVLDINAVGRWALVNLVIAPFRAPKSAKAYKELWQDRGSPLKFYTLSIKQKLQATLGEDFVVEAAMRYQSPNLTDGLKNLQNAAVTSIVVIPLFPQYASASSGSVVEEVARLISEWQLIPTLNIVGPFYQHPNLLNTFADNALKHWCTGQYQKVLFSYHGLPERQIMKGDVFNHCKLGSCCDSMTPQNALCYRAQCFHNSRLLAKLMDLEPHQFTTSFQSRLGKTPWIKPYTDEVIKNLAVEEKIEGILVLSPSFVADCLETTIEIGEEYKEIFEELGGKHWQLVESLNEDQRWVDALADMATKYRDAAIAPIYDAV